MTPSLIILDNELTDPKMREIFINPETGEAWKAGTEILKKYMKKLKIF